MEINENNNMKKSVQTIIQAVLFVVIVLLVFLIYKSIMKPVNFNKEKARRETVAIQRLKDIRTLQVTYKAENNKFASTLDSLVDFYNNGSMSVVLQVGSMDDSLAVAHTDEIKKKDKKITALDLYQMYLAGDKDLVFSVVNKIPVRDTLFNGRENFNINDIKTIPFSDGTPIEMSSVVKMVSGVPVPLFEAKMPYKQLLKGMDNQLRINLDAERKAQDRYEGLQVGSITAPNNNAGNWE